MPIFSMETLVPVSMVISLGGFIAWITRVWWTTKNNSKEINDLNRRVESGEKTQSRDSERTVRIETKVDLILSALKIVPK